MPKTKKSVAKKATKKPAYRVVMFVNEDKYTGEGDDLYAILKGMELPRFFKSETNILVTKGEKTIQKDLKVIDARRSFTGFDTTSLKLLVSGLIKRL